MFYPDGQIGAWNNNNSFPGFPELYQTFEGPEDNKFVNKQDNKLIIQQYIGIKNKNGNDIYDGDIVRYNCSVHEFEIETHVGEVYFEEGIFYFDKNMSFASNDSNFDMFSLEVIGNIFENPELLKNDN